MQLVCSTQETNVHWSVTLDPTATSLKVQNDRPTHNERHWLWKRNGSVLGTEQLTHTYTASTLIQ